VDTAPLWALSRVRRQNVTAEERERSGRRHGEEIYSRREELAKRKRRWENVAKIYRRPASPIWIFTFL
jgi:hypothetical protein